LLPKTLPADTLDGISPDPFARQGGYPMSETRLQTIQRIIGGAGLDAVALVPGSNMIYMTGQHFHLMERPVVGLYPRVGNPAYIMGLELDKMADLPDIRTFSYTDEEGYTGAFKQAIAALSLDGKKLGVEGLRMRYTESAILAQFAPQMQIIDATDTLAELRLRKEKTEIDALRAAIKISEAALREIIAGVKVGMDERKIANSLQIAMLQRGGGELPFPPIVLTGPKSALPHGVPGDRPLSEGELLLIDYGTTFDGYASDITRTFVLGELRDQQLVDAYAAVQAANEAGRNAAGPGVPCQEVDRAARAAIVRAGFGAYFIHRTGHGLGMEAHEGPYIREGNAAPLEVGNVFTVEPGIYLPGIGGIRIEDNVVITADGAESLTTFPRDLNSIPM
jgi:Xaa-Pro dipeptidase